MDVFRVSDGAFEQLDVGLHDFPSLEALRKAISKLIDIPLDNLILFHSSGSQLSESLYQELGHNAATESLEQAHIKPLEHPTSHPGFHRQNLASIQYDLNGNEIRSDGDKGGSGTALFAFDRESFMADPHDFVRGIEEDLLLPEALPSYPGFHSPDDVLNHFNLNLNHLQDLADRLEAQIRGLDLAGGSLGDHLDRLVYGSSRGRSSATSQSGHEHVGSSQRGIGLATARTGQPSGVKMPTLNDFRVLVDKELKRERDLIWRAGAGGDAQEGSPSWGMEQDLLLISKIEIDPFFLAKTKVKRDGRRSSMDVARVVSSGMGRGDAGKEGLIKKKFLGDWVSEAKMRTVRESCTKIYDEHERKSKHLLESFDKMQHAAEEILASIPALNREAIETMQEILQDAEALAVRSRDLLESEVAAHWEALLHLDNSMREQIVAMTELKNAFTLNLHIHLHAISGQQSIIAELSPQMAVLEESLLSTRTLAKTGFPHLDRLRNMVYAYGMACIEVVWRKELGGILHGGAGNLIEDLGTHLEDERERRHRFKDEILGLLPYEVEALNTKGETELGPSVDLSVDSGDVDLEDSEFTVETLAELLEGFGKHFQDPALVQYLGEGENPLSASLSRMRTQIEAMTASLEVVRQIWSPQVDNRSEVMVPPSKSLSALTTALRANGFAPSSEPTEIHSLRRQVVDLTNEVVNLQEQKRQGDGRSGHSAGGDVSLLEKEHQVALASLEKTLEAERITLDQERQRNATLLLQMEQQTNEHRLQMQHVESERSQILQGLSDARNDEEALARKVLELQGELDLALHAVDESKAEREGALQQQAALAEKSLRDKMTEADGDRAVLDHQVASLTEELDAVRAKAVTDVQAANAKHVRELNGLKAEMGMTKAELREAQRKASQANDVVIQEKDRAGLARAEKEKQEEFSKETIKVASAFHDCIARLHSAIQSSATISGSTSGLLPNSLQENTNMEPSAASSLVGVDYLQAELQTMKAYDLAAFTDSVTRTMGLVKKWQKSCKQYRERSKNQIAFANFAKGDLALFLPTRNASAKSWAAFNIASPHYFLKPTPAVEQMMKEREWIVGRVLAVEDGTVSSQRVPMSVGGSHNPYGLAEGIKYHELEAEAYVPAPAKPRRSASSGSQVGPGTLSRMSTTTGGHRPMTTPLTQIASPNEQGGYFPPLLDGSGRPVPERNRSSQEDAHVPRRGSHTASLMHPELYGSLRATKRPSSVSSSASSSKFSKGIQLGVGGSGKGGSVVGVTREGLVERMSRQPSQIEAHAVESSRADGKSIGTRNLDIPSQPNRRRESASGLSELGKSPTSPGASGSGNFARVAGLRTSTDGLSRGSTSLGSRKGMSVGEGALDILKSLTPK